MTAVTVTGLSIRLAGRLILDRVSFAVPAGAFVGVLGPNGAGKTTLLRALLGLVSTQAGAVSVFGTPVRLGRPDLGYVPQHRGADAADWLCGRDVVGAAMSGARWGLPGLSRTARHEVEQALRDVGAADFAHRPVHSLSGGERQRLLLAQALLGAPRMLLLDEPLISLDPSGQRAIVRLVAGLQRHRGLTVLFCSHEINPLLPALDHVLYLAGGRAALGPVDEVVTGPVLSTLYNAPIQVIRSAGRVFVLDEDARETADA